MKRFTGVRSPNSPPYLRNISLPDQKPEADDIIIDGLALVRALPPKRCERGEEKDLEFARKIDQEMRNEYGGSPVIVAENNAILEEHDERDEFSGRIEFLESTDENIETDETDLIIPEENSPRISNMDDLQEDEEEVEVNERNDCQSQLFQGILDSLRVSQDVTSVNGEEIGASGVHVNQVAQDEVHQNDSSDNSNGDDSGNPSFCIENVHKLLGDDDDNEEEEEEDEDDDEDEPEEEGEEEEDEAEDEEEEEEDDDDDDDDDDEVEEEQSEDEVDGNIEINDNPTFMMENIQCLFGYTDNDDDDDDDERFHSACDDITTAFWGGDDDLAMQDGSEEDADTNTYWQIMNREPLLED
ncbi:glutamic acid-rich protein-like [Macrobrachium nipponense]|uniref:glutamic acid-rich protein-like n=1 Tax=Macrobrachium nipponense TaxID=159736 RepID=UPI0030C7C8CA